MCGNCNLNIDVEQVDEFGQKLLEIVNHGGLSLIKSMGHRARLFDIMNYYCDDENLKVIAHRAMLSELEDPNRCSPKVGMKWNLNRDFRFGCMLLLSIIAIKGVDLLSGMKKSSESVKNVQFKAFPCIDFGVRMPIIWNDSIT